MGRLPIIDNPTPTLAQFQVLYDGSLNLFYEAFFNNGVSINITNKLLWFLKTLVNPIKLIFNSKHQLKLPYFATPSLTLILDVVYEYIPKHLRIIDS